VKRFRKKIKIFETNRKKRKIIKFDFLASKLNFEKKLSIPMLIKTLATIVEKKLVEKVVFPKIYKTFRKYLKKNTNIDFI
jgi:DNA-binding HxlR family transcriptional regulator